MATEFEKTYTITLKYTYQGVSEIDEDDMNVAILRADVKKWIEGKVGHISKGNLSAHIVGDVSEA